VLASTRSPPVPALLVFFLMAFATKAKIEKLARDNCFGCQHNKGAQKEHMDNGCLSPIEDLLVFYEEAERQVNFGELMRRLTLELSWPFQRLPTVPSAALTQEIIAGTPEVLCEDCRPLQSLYDHLFCYLGFDQ
jgi:hypothetical protein